MYSHPQATTESGGWLLIIVVRLFVHHQESNIHWGRPKSMRFQHPTYYAMQPWKSFCGGRGLCSSWAFLVLFFIIFFFLIIYHNVVGKQKVKSRESEMICRHKFVKTYLLNTQGWEHTEEPHADAEEYYESSGNEPWVRRACLTVQHNFSVRGGIRAVSNQP